jgi:hypothetical protein
LSFLKRRTRKPVPETGSFAEKKSLPRNARCMRDR